MLETWASSRQSPPWLSPPPWPSKCLRGLANGPQTVKEFDMTNVRQTWPAHWLCQSKTNGQYHAFSAPFPRGIYMEAPSQPMASYLRDWAWQGDQSGHQVPYVYSCLVFQHGYVVVNRKFLFLGWNKNNKKFLFQELRKCVPFLTLLWAHWCLTGVSITFISINNNSYLIGTDLFLNAR